MKSTHKTAITVVGNMIKFINFKSKILAISILLFWPSSSFSQVIALPQGKSEYRYNQSNGISNSVAVGITSSFGVNSSAQASPSYNASSSAALVLDTNSSPTPANLSTLPNYNSSIQAVGTEANNSPVNVKINSQTVQIKSTDGSTAQETVGSKQMTNASEFSDSGSSSSTANFSAEGFGAIQDLRFRGGNGDTNSDSTKFAAEVLPILNVDESGNTTSGTAYGTGSANSNAETKTRFQADITTSTFVNSFLSSY
jgi:hypothetical protein